MGRDGFSWWRTPTAQQPESVLSSSQESGIEVTEDSLGLDEGTARMLLVFAMRLLSLKIFWMFKMQSRRLQYSWLEGQSSLRSEDQAAAHLESRSNKQIHRINHQA